MYGYKTHLVKVLGIGAGLWMSTASGHTESAAQLERWTSTLRDAAGQGITASTPAVMPLFEARKGNAVLAPDGHQVTFGEFTAMNGSIDMKCTARGTRTSLHLTGLIPNGVYTIWIFTYKPPEGTMVSAAGALGADPNGTGNILVADESGEAFLTALNPAGPLTATGEVAGCLETDEFRTLIEGVYHIDGKTYGKFPGPPGSWVEQFSFTFRKANRAMRFIHDMSGAEITASTPLDTPLLEARKSNPIIAPDGHQITLAEFNKVQGSASVKCTVAGTRTTLQMRGLIPNATYTVWLVRFIAPGGPSNLVGLGAVGRDNGVIQNLLVADEDGEASFSAVNIAGPLSHSGSTESCWTDSAQETHVVGYYHIDGLTYGGDPGPDGTGVEHFAFVFPGRAANP